MNNRIEKFEGLYEFLSNKHPSTLYYKGLKYKSVAHAYQSLKAKHDTDANRIRNCKTSTEAIQEGRKSEVKDGWQDLASDIMKELIYQKFDNVFLRPKLLETDGIELGNKRNFVGTLLMEIREQIKEETKNG